MAGVEVRHEQAGDRAVVRVVNEAAFARPDEADLVQRLWDEGAVLASFVADRGGVVVGHILFSRMYIDSMSGSVAAVALAPMAVDPRYQRTGIGGALIEYGLDWLRESGEAIAVVVGHPGYYPRLGFESASAEQLESPFPPHAFMALELAPGALEGLVGRVRYPRAFGV
jgi:putative acetyltransferase